MEQYKICRRNRNNKVGQSFNFFNAISSNIRIYISYNINIHISYNIIIYISYNINIYATFNFQNVFFNKNKLVQYFHSKMKLKI